LDNKLYDINDARCNYENHASLQFSILFCHLLATRMVDFTSYMKHSTLTCNSLLGNCLNVYSLRFV